MAADYWGQFGQDTQSPPPYLSTDPTTGSPMTPGRTMDPSQAIPNTGINGGGGFTYNSGPNTGVNVPSGGYPNADNETKTIPGSSPIGNGGLTLAGAQDPQAFFNQLFPGQSLSPQDLAAHEAELNAQGIKIIRNAAGQPSKIQLPDGSVVDPIIGAGSGQNTKAWNVVAGPGGVPTGGGGTSLGNLGFGSGSFVSPIGQFTPPTAQDALNSPGTQYALDEANRMMQNSAAARGTLLNGRVLQAENAATLANANTLYGDVYNRAANTFGINFGVQTRNQDAPYSKYLSLAQLGQGAAAAS